MVKKIKGKLGTYTNDGLGSVFEIDDEVISEMSSIIFRDKEKIKKDYLSIIRRIGTFINNEIGSYADEEDFANYFFDKKGITQWGSNLPKITEEEVLRSAIEHYNQLKKKLAKVSSKKQKRKIVLTTFKWLKSDDLLTSLYEALIKYEFISRKTKYQDFKYVFSNQNAESLENKITWLKIGRNKDVNKRSISDLVKVLIDIGYIDKRESLPKLLSYCFNSEEEYDLKFFHSNLSTTECFSEHRQLLEDIVANL